MQPIRDEAGMGTQGLLGLWGLTLTGCLSLSELSLSELRNPIDGSSNFWLLGCNLFQ